MTITLESLEVEQNRLAEMIAAFKRQSASTEYQIQAAHIVLAPGEQYAGVILGKDGAPDHHLILLPSDTDDVNWQDAKAWAAEQGGELPTRREQSLLFANLKSEFETTWYWSSEQHEKESGWAWYQYFSYGYQFTSTQSSALRARAVRRLILQ